MFWGMLFASPLGCWLIWVDKDSLPEYTSDKSEYLIDLLSKSGSFSLSLLDLLFLFLSHLLHIFTSLLNSSLFPLHVPWPT